HDGLASWVSRLCSTLSPIKFSPVLLRCTRWPGATVVSYNDKFANVYIGDGHKDQSRFVPPPLPPLQTEYAVEGGAGNIKDVTEQSDPTLAEETAFEEERRAREEEQQEESDDEEGEGGEEDGSDT
ncbi:hypothetical protein HKX48_000422, partial [Thoreauomyces humboldtii]